VVSSEIVSHDERWEDVYATASRELESLKARQAGHDQGTVLRDLAVMLADGGDCLTDIGALGDQASLFGDVASASTAFRLVDRIARDPEGLERLRVAHAMARARTCGSSRARRSG
jgi:hypothetical protein